MITSTPKELQRAGWIIFVLLLVSVFLWANTAAISNFQVPAALPLHTALETATIVLFSSVFIVCWNAFDEIRKKNSVILAVAFLCTAIFGFFHAISFQGMPGFLAANDMHKSLSFWLLSRAIVTATLLGLAINFGDAAVSPKTSRRFLTAGVFLTLATSLLIFIRPDYLPSSYVEGSGQTAFKINCEILIICINIITASLLFKQARAFPKALPGEHLQINRAHLFLASAMMAMSEVYFSLYINANEIFVVIGHVFQVISALAIYRSMVAINIHGPYATLSEASKNLVATTEELQRHKRRLAGIIETAIDGIITIDEEHKMILVNPAAAALFGNTVEELIGSSLNQVIPSRHRAAHDTHVKKFGETGVTRRKMGTDFDDFYVTGLRSDGSEFPIEASISSLIENGQRYYTVIFRDITERKLAKEKIAQNHTQLSQLSSALQSIREEERKHIARELHDDLGQLLAALRMDLSLLQRDSLISEKSQKNIASMDQLILTSITTLRRIATDLRPRALDEGGLFFALQTLRKDFSARHGIDCELRANEEQLMLDDAHSTAIFRIIQESLTNVVRHSKASEVQIEFNRTPESLEFSINDNGQGIEETDMHKVSSFGLVGMRERVKAMHGRFELSSVLGEGTSLKISIPLSEDLDAQNNFR
ncbi:MASE3 domain-containing protein [Undibacterium parvum]|uniref:PAS domain S-box protein n=1 Tax=Undibacterium parvum TaxID=401471 RepID=A0A3Q9BSS1_9BURK|nr:MASE3 domain-containing protein [Undibacterium parvum]AZP13428.1 PAS domain S-box protein [Undibacterium parvum]